MYYASWDEIAFDSTGDGVRTSLLSVEAATGDPIRLWGFGIYPGPNTSIVQAGNETQVEMFLERRVGSPTAGTGTTVTPNPARQGDVASSATVLENLTVEATGGTVQKIHRFGWNARYPYIWYAPPDMRLQMGSGEIFFLAHGFSATGSGASATGWSLFEEV
jgi:hypothetical protein